MRSVSAPGARARVRCSRSAASSRRWTAGRPTSASPFPPIAIAHGTYDPVIPVEFGRAARATLEGAGAEVLYLESPIEHSIDPQVIPQLRALV